MALGRSQDREAITRATRQALIAAVTFTAFVVVDGFFAAPLAARQVAARQGTFDASRRFTSPMIVEAPLPVLPGFKQTFFGREIGEYICDDVSLQKLSYQVVGNRKKLDRATVIEFHGVVEVPPSWDREVDVAVTVKRGEERLGSRSKLRIDAEEGRETSFSIQVPIGRLESLIDTGVKLTVEMTVTVRDNK